MHMQVHARIRARSTEASAPQVLSLSLHVKEPPTTLVQYISAIVVRVNGGGCTVLHSKV